MGVKHRLTALLSCLVLLGLSSTSPKAMEMELLGDTLIFSATLMGADDYIKYKELVKGRQVKNVVLINQPGGYIPTAMGIAEDLIERGANTVVAGSCASACTYLFLAGRERQFSAKVPIWIPSLAFHGAYDTRSGVVHSGN
jgi:hypothetical protein